MLWTAYLRRLLATRMDRVVTVVTALLLVAVGYLAGYWTQESRKEVPLVFEGVQGGQAGAVLSASDLKALAEAAGSDDSPTKSAGDVRTKGGPILASVNGQKYYFADCKEVQRIAQENRISFASAQEAEESGYEPSQCVLKTHGR